MTLLAFQSGIIYMYNNNNIHRLVMAIFMEGILELIPVLRQILRSCRITVRHVDIQPKINVAQASTSGLQIISCTMVLSTYDRSVRIKHERHHHFL